MGDREGASAGAAGWRFGDPMREPNLQSAARLEAEAAELHRRSQIAQTLPASVILRFRALWKEEAARLLRRLHS